MPERIWAYFDVVPVDEAWTRIDWQASSAVQLGGSVHGRRADLGQDAGGVETNTGVEGYGRVRFGAYHLGATAFAWGGTLAPLAGVNLEASRPLSTHLDLDAHASIWHFDDPLRQDYAGTSLSESLGFRLALSRSTKVTCELEHAYSPLVGNRFRGLATLSFEVWR